MDVNLQAGELLPMNQKVGLSSWVKKIEDFLGKEAASQSSRVWVAMKFASSLKAVHSAQDRWRYACVHIFTIFILGSSCSARVDIIGEEAAGT